jgi:ArsR family transcriptional regulator, arsenate/arsenite/antimonite-responsive transcriptional repressor
MRRFGASRIVELFGTLCQETCQKGRLDITQDFGRVRLHEFDGVRNMEMKEAINRFSALATPSRLQALKLLARHEEGLASGELARRLEVPANTISTQLFLLANADLVRSRRESRHIVYTANVDAVRELIDFLDEECAGGRCKRPASSNRVSKGTGRVKSSI